MKNKTAIIIALFAILTANAQLVEHYENPQRFQFEPFEHNLTSLTFFNEQMTRDTVFLSKKCTRDNSHTLIYGIAIPLALENYYLYDTINYLNKVIKSFDTNNYSVIIGNTTASAGYDYELVDTASFRIGKSALIGNYFKMCESDSSYLGSIYNPLYFNILEVYFNEPVRVTERFIIGMNLIHNFANGYSWQHVSPLTFRNAVSDVVNYDSSCFSYIVNGSYVNTNPPDYPWQASNFSWGAPFPILAPAPCMPPIWMKVAEQHRMGATIEWRAQYANTAFEVEYGPQGFAEGTGTTVGPIAPDAQYKGSITLSNLAMDADYTVRVRSYCNNSGGYSDWTEMDFHTGTFYAVNTASNNDDWGYVVGGGEYPADTTIRLFAYPRNGYHPFLNWSDGNNQNPRIVTVTRDTSFTAVFDNTEGIAGAEQPFVTVSPNPASGTTTVASDIAIAEWTLFDIQGRAVASGTPKAESATIDLNALHPAIYILTVGTEKGTVTRKIVVK